MSGRDCFYSKIMIKWPIDNKMHLILNLIHHTGDTYCPLLGLNGEFLHLEFSNKNAEGEHSAL